MKHSFLIITMLSALLFIACKPEDKVQINNAETTTVQFSISHAGNPAFRKANGKHNAPANVEGIKTLVYAVYDAEGNKIDALSGKQDNAFKPNGEQYTTTLSLELVKGQTYSLAFFAYSSACTAAYNTKDLKSISIDYGKLTANDETADAFFGNIPTYTVGAAEAKNSVTLRRPFAQLNLAVSDYDKAQKAGVEIEKSSLKITNIATGFNALDGKITGTSEAEVTILAGNIPTDELTIGEGDQAKEYKWLSMNYILAGDATTGEATALSDVTFILSVKAKEETSTTTPQPIKITSANTPLQRNHRTNILGKLTETEDFKVIIDGGFATPDKDLIDGHEYVDLGLNSGTLWATCNIGATQPEEYGNFYAWGEVTPNRKYGWELYKHGNGPYDLIKYCYDATRGKNSYTDDYTTLLPEDDAAQYNWKGVWRMPTASEMIELVDECTWQWEPRNGVNGYKVTGKHGKSIFLPDAGYYQDETHHSSADFPGNYWASTLDSRNATFGGCLFIKENEYFYDIELRWYGLPIRPVCKKP